MERPRLQFIRYLPRVKAEHLEELEEIEALCARVTNDILELRSRAAGLALAVSDNWTALEIREARLAHIDQALREKEEGP